MTGEKEKNISRNYGCIVCIWKNILWLTSRFSVDILRFSVRSECVCVDDADFSCCDQILPELCVLFSFNDNQSTEEMVTMKNKINEENRAEQKKNRNVRREKDYGRSHETFFGWI